jgi:hypothetical protein
MRKALWQLRLKRMRLLDLFFLVLAYTHTHTHCCVFSLSFTFNHVLVVRVCQTEHMRVDDRLH